MNSWLTLLITIFGFGVFLLIAVITFLITFRECVLFARQLKAERKEKMAEKIDTEGKDNE